MGNGGLDGPAREVTLCLHSVHNVEHLPNESYYGMATASDGDETVPVTSERSARLLVRADSVVSVRIFLHERGAPSCNDRCVGQLAVPVQEVVSMCGPGIYQTWFLLDSTASYNAVPRSRLAERFRQALHGVSQELRAPRVCLTLLESDADPAFWATDEAAQITYYDALLVAHAQHLQATRGYFDLTGSGDDPLSPQLNRPVGRRCTEGARAGDPAHSARLHAELERLQKRQREEEATAQIAQLQAELDQVTDEANRRIEKGNEAILKLKAQLKDLRDVDAPNLISDRSKVEQQLEAARRRNGELTNKVNAPQTSPDDADFEDLAQLRQEILVLTNQKEALMKMVQDVYGAEAQAKADAAADARKGGTPKSAAGAGAVGFPDMREDSDLGIQNLLPDPHEILGDVPYRPL